MSDPTEVVVVSAIEVAKRQLQSIAPIPWYQLEQVANEVRRANPSVEGEALSNLIVEEVLKEWTNGMGCC